MQRLKNLALTVSKKNNVKVLFKGGTMPIISLEHALKKIIYLMQSTIEQSFNLID